MLDDYEPGDRYLPQYTSIVYCWRTRRRYVAVMQDLGGKAVVRMANDTLPDDDEMYQNAYREKGGKPVMHSLVYNYLRSRAQPLTCAEIARGIETNASTVRKTIANAPDVFCELGRGGYKKQLNLYGLIAWGRKHER